MSNRLADESSPYLLQHAENPVDWYPWGPDALGRAEQEDRPILLSVGYSSCHWCHVMERESFEDPSTAGLMNEHFVNVKVDREERPDVDQIYMKAVQAMTGRGGWPMTVFLTPSRVPFFGGTYYPPEPRHGMPSFTQVLTAVADAWENRRQEVDAGSTRLMDALAAATRGGEARSVGRDVLDLAVAGLSQRYDATHGGFGGAPKFPQPMTLELLVRHHLRTGSPESVGMAVHTLRRMAAGGIRDHLGGGFHRYSVDERWLVPHFEKMLYDNALLASAYLDGYRLTGADDLREVAVETLDYLTADMRAPEGGFYSARDADSEGEEGVFYVWSAEEIEEVLGADDARLVSAVYGVTEAGNFEGANILHRSGPVEAVADAEGMEVDDVERRLSDARARLLERRSGREHPFRDEKVLVAWNGLAIRAFAESGATLDRPDYLRTATDAAAFVWSTLRVDGRLLHSFMDGEAKIGGFLDDHAALGNAFLSLHAATLERRWLDAALWLGGEIVSRFWDAASETLYDTAADAEEMIVRPRDPMDNATPSGSSLTAELLGRLSLLTSDDDLAAIARRIVDREAEGLERFGTAYGRMLSVLDAMLAEPVEIVISAPDAKSDEARALVGAAHAELLRRVVVAGLTRDDDPAGIALFEGRAPRDVAQAYVCRRYVCERPTSEPEGVARAVAALRGGGSD